jgi:hypothetical protein
MTGSSRTRTSPRRDLRFLLFCRQIAAAVAALLLAASPLTEALHTLLVPHTLCAEHGEVVHLENEASSLLSAPSSEGVAFEANEAGQNTGHEHCPVVLDGLRRLAPQHAASALLLPAPVAVDTCAAYDLLLPHPSVELTLLAPKTSPPRIRA